jgi:hypothetical protein
MKKDSTIAANDGRRVQHAPLLARVALVGYGFRMACLMKLVAWLYNL